MLELRKFQKPLIGSQLWKNFFSGHINKSWGSQTEWTLLGYTIAFKCDIGGLHKRFKQSKESLYIWRNIMYLTLLSTILTIEFKKFTLTLLHFWKNSWNTQSSAEQLLMWCVPMSKWKKPLLFYILSIFWQSLHILKWRLGTWPLGTPNLTFFIWKVCRQKMFSLKDNGKWLVKVQKIWAI